MKVSVSAEWTLSRPNFYKQAKWSPDGNCILSSTEDRELNIHSHNDNSTLVTMREAEAIHDVDWYPWMKTSEASSCCFISCSRDAPIHLWDSSIGHIRCSYVCYDQMDQVSTSFCCIFSADGASILAGTRLGVNLFDALKPGRATTVMTGLKAPVSTINVRKDNTALIAAGTFSGSIGLFDNRAAKILPATLSNEHKQAITQVKFANDGWTIFSVARREQEIIQWDLRNGSVAGRYGLRQSTSCQRIYFDCTAEHLFTGDQAGNLLQFPIKTSPELTNLPISSQSLATSTSLNCVSVNQADNSMLAVTLGERSFDIPDIGRLQVLKLE